MTHTQEKTRLMSVEKQTRTPKAAQAVKLLALVSLAGKTRTNSDPDQLMRQKL